MREAIFQDADKRMKHMKWTELFLTNEEQGETVSIKVTLRQLLD